MTHTFSDIDFSALASWFEDHRRDLPWRAQNLDAPHPDPYAVLVSELMLQQTQVATVIPFFERWMVRFPDVHSLAHTNAEELHRQWQGLGYYRRAVHLQNAAKRLVLEGWPSNLEGLLKLPGLGPYTAAAVASIAFQWPEPALDGNAFRVLARLLALEGDPTRQAPALRTWLRPSLSRLGPSRLTQAIMELGATVCTPSSKCAACPLSTQCQAWKRNLVAHIPPPKVRPLVKEVSLNLLGIEAQGHWLLQAPRQRGLLAGLWRWPSLDAPQDRIAESLDGFEPLQVQIWSGWTQVYTHRKEAVLPCAMKLESPIPFPPGFAWVSVEALATLPMGKRDQRFRELLLKKAPPEGTQIWSREILKAL